MAAVWGSAEVEVMRRKYESSTAAIEIDAPLIRLFISGSTVNRVAQVLASIWDDVMSLMLTFSLLRLVEVL